jgi:hypothetical protein
MTSALVLPNIGHINSAAMHTASTDDSGLLHRRINAQSVTEKGLNYPKKSQELIGY